MNNEGEMVKRKKIRQQIQKKNKTTNSQAGIGVDGERYTAPPASGMEEAGSTSEQSFF